MLYLHVLFDVALPAGPVSAHFYGTLTASQIISGMLNTPLRLYVKFHTLSDIMAPVWHVLYVCGEGIVALILFITHI